MSDVDEGQCPYCGSRDGCAHHLLTVDTIFRSAQDGALYERFSDAWSERTDLGEEQDGDDFDEADAFDELLEAVSALADAEREVEADEVPGLSTVYRCFYCSSANRVKAAVTTFSAGED